MEDPIAQISLADARMIAPRHVLGDIVQIPIDSHDFGRIATQNAKNVILQKIREESRKSQVSRVGGAREKEVVTGIVQRYIGRNVSVDLGKIDAILPEAEQVKRRDLPENRAYQGFISWKSRTARKDRESPYPEPIRTL